MSSRGRERLIQATAVAVPVVLFMVSRSLLELGPAVAPAAVPANAAPVAPTIPPPREPTPAQRRAADWARDQRPTHNIRSPMTRIALAQQPDPAPDPIDPTPIPTVPPPPEPATRFTVTSLLESGTQQMATINGVTYSPGDEIAPGFRLVGVHGHRRVVVISCPDGGTVELKPRP